MGPASFLGLLIFVLAVAIVLQDAKAQTARAPKAVMRPEQDRPIVPTGTNDPSVTDLASRIAAGVAQGITAAAAGGVLGAETGIVRGAAAGPRVSNATVQEAIEISQRAAYGSGAVTGAQTAGPAAATGSGIFSFFPSLVASAVEAQRASESLPGPRNAYELPILGGVFRAADALNLPKL